MKLTLRGSPQYGCSSVTLFTLSAAGKLHQPAIILDYRSSIEKSVTIFNQRLTPNARDVDERTNWPWRYAKTCSQVYDWTRHEFAVHPSDAQLLQEALILSTLRNFPPDHIISSRFSNPVGTKPSLYIIWLVSCSFRNISQTGNINYCHIRKS